MTARVVADRKGAVGWLTLDNPGKRNATSLAMYEAIPAALAQLTESAELRVVVLRGAGNEAFGAGSDISEFAELRLGDNARAYNAVEERATEALLGCPVPLISMVQGPCLGGGLGLALCSDLRVAAHNATFGVPPGRLGIGYPPDAARRLARLVGPAVAKELVFTARVVDADEALRQGLVNRVVPATDLVRVVEELAAEIARLAPLTLRAAKLAIDDHPEASVAAERCFWSADYREGIAAFMDKRRPTFNGS